MLTLTEAWILVFTSVHVVAPTPVPMQPVNGMAFEECTKRAAELNRLLYNPNKKVYTCIERKYYEQRIYRY